MGDRERGDETLSGLAKRWLKTQLRFHGDPHKAVGDRREAEALECRIEDKARDDLGSAVVGALMPESWKRKLEGINQLQAEERVASERRRRERHAALPRATVDLAISGDVQGEYSGALPAEIQEPIEPGDALTVVLEPLDELIIGTQSFNGFQFAVPGYTGDGT